MVDALSIFAPMIASLDSAGPDGLRVEAWGPVSAAVAMAYRGAERAAGERLSAFVRSDPDASILNTGPGTWLILRNDVARASPDLDDVAATFDQGDGYALLRLHGAVAMTVLQKGIFVDLDRALTDHGSCVSSVIAHVNVIVWRMSGAVYDVAVPRSFAGSFWHWLNASVAAEGLSIGH